MVISLTGGGGKTTTMYYLGDYYAKYGKKVIITTTTHILKPESYLEVEKAKELADISWNKNPIVIGRDAGEKLASIDFFEVEKLKDFADVLLIEADGAKRLPIKFPKEGEPVITSNTEVCIVCMGVDAVSKSLKSMCFRSELAYDIFGWKENHILSCEDAARMLTHKDVGLKGTKDCKIIFLINKADTLEDVKKALEIEKYINIFCKKINLNNYKVSITSYNNNRGFGDFGFI